MYEYITLNQKKYPYYDRVYYDFTYIYAGEKKKEFVTNILQTGTIFYL